MPPTNPLQEQEIMNPLVFQCKHCRSVIGDSFTWVGADQELNAVILSAKATGKVIVGELLQFASDGVDIGR